MSLNAGRPYFYLKAGDRSREITRNYAGGSTSICIPTEDGGWVDYTLSMTLTSQNEKVVVFSSRNNRQDRETVLLREVVL